VTVQQRSVLAHERRIGALGAARSLAWPVWRFARRQPVGFISLAIILALIVIAVLAPLIAPYDATEVAQGARLASPSLSHPFGTDNLSRDIFSRVVLGARVSIEVGFIAVVIGVGGGAAVGVLSGYTGGKLDMGLQRLMDALMTFPTLVLAMTLTAIIKPDWFAMGPWLPPGMVTAMLAIGIVIMPSANRVVRGATMSIKENQYVEAARAVGASNTRIMVFHILPNLVAPILVMVSIVMGLAIIVEASLSFLGLGIQPPSISWGRMVSESRIYMELAPWMVVAPAVAISVIVLALNLLGDALRDYFDPSLRGR